jgi:hypothetical protein
MVEITSEGSAAMRQTETGLEWAGERERAAIEEENGGFFSCYLAVTARAYEAQRLARERALADA